MEKIKTPLGGLLEWGEEKYNDLNVQSQTSNESGMQYAYAMVIDKINSLLPTERDMIESFADKYMTNTDPELTLSDLFSQTFKTYE